METKNVIDIKNLTKSFKDVKAVDNLSFQVRRGELFAFLGVNGAGKSTTINILANIIQKDGGEVLINGVKIEQRPDDSKREIGIVFQSSVLDSAMCVYDNLKFRAALYGIVGAEFEKRIAELSETLDFASYLSRPVGKLSGGQKRRVDIARAIFHKPEILILDEPTTGLDPQTRRLLWNVISELRKNENLTVLLTTHYMEEAANADYVVIIDDGKIAAEGTPRELKNKYTNDFLTLYGKDEVHFTDFAQEKVVGGIRISVPSTKAVTEMILKNPELFVDYEVVKGRMDDVFLAVTGKSLKEEKEK